MEALRFWKMQGSGNDFIVFDNRDCGIPEDRLSNLALRLCRRKTSVGADGLIAVQDSHGGEADFRWRFFNADGSEGEMCGNGGRCVARFALAHGISGPRLAFETLAGIIAATVEGDRVTIGLPPPTDLALDCHVEVDGVNLEVHRINTGVPHVAILLETEEALEKSDVAGLGRALRNHEAFAPAGTNADFIWVESPSALALRTYERGVEEETLACGTGAVAAALVAITLGLATPPVAVRTTGGEVLTVRTHLEAGRFTSVRLEGEARMVYSGRLPFAILDTL